MSQVAPTKPSPQWQYRTQVLPFDRICRGERYNIIITQGLWQALRIGRHRAAPQRGGGAATLRLSLPTGTPCEIESLCRRRMHVPWHAATHTHTREHSPANDVATSVSCRRLSKWTHTRLVRVGVRAHKHTTSCACECAARGLPRLVHTTCSGRTCGKGRTHRTHRGQCRCISETCTALRRPRDRGQR